MRDRIKRVMSRAFRMPAEEIPDDATVNELKQWSSLAHMELMMEIEAEFDVRINAQQMLEMVSLEQIQAFLDAQGRG